MWLRGMPYCPKCGSKVEEDMVFCPKCGASLKAEQPSARPAPPQGPVRVEKEEKTEKKEKREKSEKHEKGEAGWIGPLVGGLILIVLGFMFYLAVIDVLRWGHLWPFALILIGVIVIIGAIAAATAARRYPKT